MNKYLHIKWIRIIVWSILFFAIALLLYAIDLHCLQTHPKIFLNKYSEVVLAIWQVQAGIASLTIAATAFILGRIDESYYGISIKNLLHLSRCLPKVGLSFWEKLIFSILTLVITWFFVILNNISVVTFMFFVTIYLTSSILVECINVITKSEIYSTFAKNLVDQMVEIIMVNPYKYEIWEEHNIEKNAWVPDENQKEARVQFLTVMDEINAEVSRKIKSEIYIWDDDTFQHFLKIENRFYQDDEAELFDYLYQILCEWLRLAIESKTEKNIRTLLAISYSNNKNTHWITRGISIFMNSYYRGEIYPTCFQAAINEMCTEIRQSYDDYTYKALEVLHTSIDNADVNTFTQVIKSVWLSHPYEYPNLKGNVIITALAYLYYLTLKEDYIPIEKGQPFIEKLKDFLEAFIIEKTEVNEKLQVKDIFIHINTILPGSKFLLDFLGNFKIQWEYMPVGEVKTLQISNDVVEFLVFYCNLFYWNIVGDPLELLPLTTLIKMKSYISNYSTTIEANYHQRYCSFCNWLGKSERCDKKNIYFFDILITQIKKKMFQEAAEIREKKEVWINKLNTLQKAIVELCTSSPLYIGTAIPENNYSVIRYSDFLNLKSFSEHFIYIEYERAIQSIIEELLFNKIKYALDNCKIPWPLDHIGEALDNLEIMFSKMETVSLTIDQSFNRDFFEFTKYGQFPQVIKNRINKLEGRIKNIGNWDCGYNNIAIYTDSTKMNIGYYLPENNFMSIVDELTPKEIAFVRQKYKTPTGYIFMEYSNGVGIPFDENELDEFLKVTMFKIRYVLPVKLPRNKMGFYSVMKISRD